MRFLIQRDQHITQRELLSMVKNKLRIMTEKKQYLQLSVTGYK